MRNDDRRDPTYPPPPKRVMGAPIISPPKNPTITEKAMSSILPAAISEAKGAKISLSLFLVLALMGGTYYLGVEAGKGAGKPELEALMSVHDRRLENIAKSLESIHATQQMHGSSLTTIDSRMHNLNTEIQVVKSHLIK